MRRYINRQHHRALGAARLTRLDDTLNGNRGTGGHYLSRRIEADRVDHLILGRLGTDRQYIGVFQT